MTAPSLADVRRALLLTADAHDMAVTTREVGVLAAAVTVRLPGWLAPDLGACPLTARQLQVLRLIAGGLPDAEAAARLAVSQATVRDHVKGAVARLGARGRMHAVALCMAAEWITGADVEPPTVPLPPAEPSAPPMPRRTPPGPSGDNAARFPAPASRQSAGRSEAPTRNGPQDAPGGVSRALGAPGGPVPASSIGATTTATSHRID